MKYSYFGVTTAILLVCGMSLPTASTAQGFSLECRPNERIARVVVRTGSSAQPQFIGIDCTAPGGARRILKAGIEEGTRHEIRMPKELRQLRYTKGNCGGHSGADTTRVCSMSFRFADQTGTSEIGTSPNQSGTVTRDGNGEIYGIAGVFRSGQNNAENGFTDFRVVTRKLEAHSDPQFDIAGVLTSIQAAMGGSMGYVAVIRNPQGERVGFVRAGWAIHPLDTSLAKHAGQFDVHTMAAVGSTTKAWASAVAALRVDEFTQADTLNTPFKTYLPRRWRDELHPRFEGVSVLDVIKHRAGFRGSGPSTTQTGGEFPARFRLRTGEVWPGVTAAGLPDEANASAQCNAGSSPYCWQYSNASGGMFHFILAHMMLASESGAPAFEDSISGLSDDDYDRAIAEFTGAFYEDFVQKHILAPADAVATCGTQQFLGIRQVAASYSDGGSDRTGVLPEDVTGHCASGGWVLSANDLSRVLSALRHEGILQPLSRAKLLNLGESRVWDVTIRGGGQRHHSHSGLHDGMNAAVLIRNEGHTAVLIYNTSLGNEFSNQRLLVNAFDNNRRPN